MLIALCRCPRDVPTMIINIRVLGFIRSRVIAGQGLSWTIHRFFEPPRFGARRTSACPRGPGISEIGNRALNVRLSRDVFEKGHDHGASIGCKTGHFLAQFRFHLTRGLLETLTSVESKLWVLFHARGKVRHEVL